MNYKLHFFLLGISISLGLTAHNANEHLLYEENKGQWEKQVLYRVKLKNMDVFYEKNSITVQQYDLHELLHNNHPKSKEELLKDKSTAYFHSYKIGFINSNKNPTLVTNKKADTYANYYIGNNPSKWASEVGAYEEFIYKNLYQGIDLKIYSNGLQPKYDFILKPNSSVEKIKMNYNGVATIKLVNQALIIKTSIGEITEEKPYAYQIINNRKVEIACNYVLTENTISFDFPNGYDKNYELIIDPVLSGSTYSGSFADNWGSTATYDNLGNIYSGGIVTATGYPVTTGAFQTTFGGGGVGGVGAIPWDMAIIKYNQTGANRIFATYLGGSENDYPHSMIVNDNNELYIYGKTYSVNFPVSANAYDKTYNGNADIVVTKFNAAGSSLLGSTYIGSTGDDGVNGDANSSSINGLKHNYGDDARGEIILDANGAVYIASSTKSTNFPTTVGAYKTTFNGGPQDACVFKLNTDCSNLEWSTFLGGSSDDAGYAIALDQQNNVLVCGGTISNDFPTTSGVLKPTFNGFIDGYVSKIKFDGTTLLGSTYIGTSNYDQCYFIQTDKTGNVYLYGQTEGVYPTTAGVYKSTKGGLFIHQLDPILTTTGFSTIIGDGINSKPNISPTAFLVDNCGNIYISGWGGLCNTPGNQGTTLGLPVTTNAYKGTTDDCDFYLLSLTKNAASLLYATFFGSNNTSSGDHVDGGTSRFDKRGVVYQSVCAGCGAFSTFPTTSTAWSTTNNSPNCNNATFKIDFQTPNVVASASTNGVSGCAPFTITFNNGSANATSYKWNFDDGSPISNSPTPTHTFATQGTYNVKLVVENPASCNGKDSVIVPVVITESFTMELGPNIDLACDSLASIKLDAGNITGTFLWNTGATTSSITPTGAGKYWLKVVNGNCTVTDTINLIGNPLAAGAKIINVPNVFSPNGDGKNDLLNITTKGIITEYNIKIYNRWGLLVFETSDATKAWDGKISGSDANAGTYYYLLNFTSTCLKKPVDEKGFITLLR